MDRRDRAVAAGRALGAGWALGPVAGLLAVDLLVTEPSLRAAGASLVCAVAATASAVVLLRGGLRRRGPRGATEVDFRRSVAVVLLLSSWGHLAAIVDTLVPPGGDLGAAHLLWLLAASAAVLSVAGHPSGPQRPGARARMLLDSGILAVTLLLVSLEARGLVAAEPVAGADLVPLVVLPVVDCWLLASALVAWSADSWHARRGSAAVLAWALLVSVSDWLSAEALAAGAVPAEPWRHLGWALAPVVATVLCLVQAPRSGMRVDPLRASTPVVAALPALLAVGGWIWLVSHGGWGPQADLGATVVLSLVVLRLVVPTVGGSSTEDLRRAAFLDPLTGLPNRRALLERLELARQREDVVQLLFVDLDGFKTVNDVHGHAVGDGLLVAVADALRNTVPDECLAARVAGDEFAVLVPGSRERGREIGEAVVAAVDRPLNVAGRTLRLTVSAGGSGLAAGPDPEGLLRNAAFALRAAKLGGKNRLLWFDDSLAEPYRRRLTVEEGLRDPVESGGFGLALQPVVRLEDLAIVGVEALLRWRHPELGVVPPDEFIRVAEDTGRISEIGETALRLAAEAGARLASTGWDGWVSVNVSALQLADPMFPRQVRHTVEGAGFDADRLVIEVTETRLASLEEVSEVLHRLRARGMRIAIDDFGTGYSSLWRLPSLPVDLLKLDREFATASDRDSVAAVVEAVVGLAQHFGLQVVAEGIERPEQAERMRALGVRVGQGFLYARPLSLAQVEALVRPGAGWQAQAATALLVEAADERSVGSRPGGVG